MPDLPSTYIGLLAMIVVSVGGALAGIARWLHPRLDKVLSSIPLMVESESRNKEILSQLTTSFAILSRIMTSQHAEMNRDRRQIVIVEDNPLDSQMITTICAEVARRYRLSIKDVATLGEAYGLLATAVVVVLDAKLPDASVSTLNSMIEVSPVPVIVYSSEDITREMFPRAFRVIRKTGQDELQVSLKQAVEAAIVQSATFGN